MWIKKQDYLNLVSDLSDALDGLEDAQVDLRYAVDALEVAKADAAKWRKDYELLFHTPEVKADVESAFKRGEISATNKLRAWFLTTAQKLHTVVEETPDVD